MPTDEELRISQLTNLGLANGVRMERAVLRKRLQSGELTIEAVLLPQVHPALASVTMEQLVDWLPGYGRVKARRLVRSCHPNPAVRLRDATERLRREVVRAVGRS